jgi:type IV secretory pathway VirB10-like protein
MKVFPAALLALVCTLPLAAAAQWQWLDKDGRKVFSDKAPPPEIAPNRILKAPGGRMPAAAETPAPATAAAAPVAAAKPAGTDKALEDKRKQMAAAEAEQKKAEETRLAAARAENCSRARVAKANYDSGMRIARVNDKGEREIMDDSQRASELKMLNDVVSRDCK